MESKLVSTTKDKTHKRKILILLTGNQIHLCSRLKKYGTKNIGVHFCRGYFSPDLESSPKKKTNDNRIRCLEEDARNENGY